MCMYFPRMAVNSKTPWIRDYRRPQIAEFSEDILWIACGICTQYIQIHLSNERSKIRG